MQDLLKFSSMKGNAKLVKLGKVGYTFSLPSGHTCPSAQDCLSKAVKREEKYVIQDGPKTIFRCFSATQEVIYKAVREQRQYNYNLLKSKKSIEDMASLISKSLPESSDLVRIHVGGDFFTENYMRAWAKTAELNPESVFYAYTKSLPFWVNMLNDKAIPDNFKLNASKGGKHDSLIDKYGLKYAEVVYSEQEAIDKGLEIDHDDSHAFTQDKSFALLLHGVQPKGSVAAEALKKLNGKGSYSKK